MSSTLCCFQSCNVPQCAFDAGDCGVDNFGKLHRIDVQSDTHEYTMPKGKNRRRRLGPCLHSSCVAVSL